MFDQSAYKQSNKANKIYLDICGQLPIFTTLLYISHIHKFYLFSLHTGTRFSSSFHPYLFPSPDCRVESTSIFGKPINIKFIYIEIESNSIYYPCIKCEGCSHRKFYVFTVMMHWCKPHIKRIFFSTILLRAIFFQPLLLGFSYIIYEIFMSQQFLQSNWFWQVIIHKRV